MAERPPRPWRRLVEPWWLVAHAIVLVVLVTFPQLGTWQLDRWDEERAIADRLDQRLGAYPTPLEELLPVDTEMSDDDLAAFEFVPVVATGQYVADDEVAHRNRDLDGQPGFDWLTPLALGDGDAILVRRGFVPPTTLSGSVPTPASPVDGTVEVTGWLELSGTQPGFGPRDPDDGVLREVFHADVARLQQQVAATLRPMILHLVDQQPPQPGQLPVPQSAPEVDTTQNLSYAVQWFSFTAIVAIGYAIVLVRRVRHAPVASETPDETVRT